MDLEVIPNAKHFMTCYYDNSGVAANSKEPRSHKKGKYIERKYHILKELIQKENIIVRKIAFAENHVDPFSKALSSKVLRNT